MDLLLLIAGLAGLWFGTEITIRGAVSISSRLGISEFVVGVAVLSVGSDLPELAIAIDGAIKNIVGEGASDVVVGTALGSYLGQLGLVLGCAALILNLTLPKGIALRHGGALIGSLVLLVTPCAGVTPSSGRARTSVHVGKIGRMVRLRRMPPRGGTEARGAGCEACGPVSRGAVSGEDGEARAVHVRHQHHEP